jgi:hypothetical protein
VKRQRNAFRTTDEFLCPEHHIYISPSTFEYSDSRFQRKPALDDRKGHGLA